MTAAALFLGAALVGCAAQPRPEVASEASAQRDEQVIRATLADWVRAYNAGDYVHAAEIWAPDLIGWYPGAPDDTYADEQAAARKGAPAGAARVTFAVAIDEVIVSGDLAVVRDTWTQTTTGSGEGGKGAKATTFRSFEVWRRQSAGGWKVARWISSLPPG